MVFILLVCIGLRWFHWFVLLCIALHWFALVCIGFIGLHWFALVCIGLHWFALVGIGLLGWAQDWAGPALVSPSPLAPIGLHWLHWFAVVGPGARPWLALVCIGSIGLAGLTRNTQIPNSSYKL